MSLTRTSDAGTYEALSETIGALLERQWDLSNAVLVPETEKIENTARTIVHSTQSGGPSINGVVLTTANAELIGKNIIEVSFWLSKVGSPTGTATIAVWSDADSGATQTIALTFGTIDVAALTTTPTKYTFRNVTGHVMALNDAVGVKYEGGDGSNYVGVSGSNGSNYDGTDSQRSRFDSGAWQIGPSTHDTSFEAFTAMSEPIFVYDEDRRDAVNITAAKPAIVINSGSTFPIPERTSTDQTLIGMGSSIIIDVFAASQLRRRLYEFEIYRILRKNRPTGNSDPIKKSNNTDNSAIHDYDETMPEFIGVEGLGDGREPTSRSSAVLTLIEEWQFTA